MRPADFSAGAAYYPSLALDSNGLPYAAYQDAPSNMKATVMHFNDSIRVTVGMADFSAGPAFHPSLALDSSGLPCVAYQGGAYGKATVMHLPTFTTPSVAYTPITLDAHYGSRPVGQRPAAPPSTGTLPSESATFPAMTRVLTRMPISMRPFRPGRAARQLGAWRKMKPASSPSTRSNRLVGSNGTSIPGLNSVRIRRITSGSVRCSMQRSMAHLKTLYAPFWLHRFSVILSRRSTGHPRWAKGVSVDRAADHRRARNSTA